MLFRSVAMLGTFHGIALAEPDRRFRDGCRHPLTAPWNVYRTSDGWIVLCVASNDQWLRVLEVVGALECKDDARFVDGRTRVANVDAVDAIVGGWVRAQTTATATEIMRRAALPVSPVVSTPELLGKLRAAGSVRMLRDARGYEVPCPESVLGLAPTTQAPPGSADRKSTRLNSSHT